MNLEVLQKGNELHERIKLLTSKLSIYKAVPHGAVDLTIRGVKFGKTYSEHLGDIEMTNSSMPPEINKLLQAEFKIFKDKLIEIISDELRDTQIEFDNLKD